MTEFTKLAFLDVETTGLDPMRLVKGKLIVPYHEIIEVGCVLTRMDNLEVIDELSLKTKPKYSERLTEGAQRINGFTKREWRNALPLEEATQRFISFASGSMLIGGNIAFDWSFLAIALAMAGFDKEELDEHIYYSKRESHSFATGRLLLPGQLLEPNDFSGRSIAEKLKISSEPLPHRAINGARKMYEVFRAAWLYKNPELAQR